MNFWQFVTEHPYMALIGLVIICAYVETCCEKFSKWKD